MPGGIGGAAFGTMTEFDGGAFGFETGVPGVIGGASGDVAEPGSELVLIDLPEVTNRIHNGGALKFGSDGKLYLTVGNDNRRISGRRAKQAFLTSLPTAYGRLPTFPLAGQLGDQGDQRQPWNGGGLFFVFSHVSLAMTLFEATFRRRVLSLVVFNQQGVNHDGNKSAILHSD